MKRFHVHVSVANLAESIRFYNNLFGSAPANELPDYAKWMLQDPPVNFAISAWAEAKEFGEDAGDATGACCIPVRSSEKDEDKAKSACCIPNAAPTAGSCCP